MSTPAENYIERTRQRARGIEAGYIGFVVIATVVTDLTDLIPMAVRSGIHLRDKIGGSVLVVAAVAMWITMMAVEWKIRHRRDRTRYYRRIGWGSQITLVALAGVFTVILPPHKPSSLVAILIFNAGAAGCWHLWIRINALTPQQQAEFDRIVEVYEAVMVPQVYEEAQERNFEAAIAPYRLQVPEAPPAIRQVEWDIPSGRHDPKVYFIVNGTRIKIGTTVDIRKRVRALSLRMDNVALLVEGGQDMERFYHDKFKAFRIGDTEWFTSHAELVNWIARRQNGGL